MAATGSSPGRKIMEWLSRAFHLGVDPSDYPPPPREVCRRPGPGETGPSGQRPEHDFRFLEGLTASREARIARIESMLPAHFHRVVMDEPGDESPGDDDS
jgi:hypothetical protein